jgi:hypothetical protein
MRYPSKLVMRVRFPLPAPKILDISAISFNGPRKNKNNTMKTTPRIALIAAALCCSVLASTTTVDTDVVAAVKSDLSQNGQTLVQTVTKHVSASPEFACEVVKTVIGESKCDAATVASIVESAALAAPDQLRLIAQCAIAMAPESLVDVQQIVAKLDPSAGDGSVSGKEISGKEGAQVASAENGNPLDFPTGDGDVIVGPTPNTPGSRPMFPLFTNNTPPIVGGNPSTGVN